MSDLYSERGVVRHATTRRGFLRGAAAVLAVGGVVAANVGVAQAAPAGPIVGEIIGIGRFVVLSYSWGSSTGGATQQGGPTKKVDEVTFVKEIDGLSTALITAVASGDHFATASITVPGKNGKSVRYEMTDVLASGYSVDQGTTERVTLSFASAKTVRR